MEIILNSTEYQLARQQEVIGNVIPLHGLRRVERIGGVALALGTMSYEELMSVYVDCQDRATLANTEADIVAVYLDQRFPGDIEPDTAA